MKFKERPMSGVSRNEPVTLRPLAGPLTDAVMTANYWDGQQTLILAEMPGFGQENVK